MNNFSQVIRYTSCLLTIAIIVLIAGCSDNSSITSFEAENSTQASTVNNLASETLKVRQNTISLAYLDEDAGSGYDQSASCTVRFFKNYNTYRGSSCQIPNGSFFEISHGSLTPPDYIPWGDEVTITMRCEKDPVSGEMIFTFGPSGCQFDPPAKLWLDWTDLGSQEAKLFLINQDGSRVEQTPDQVDVNNKHMLIKINHFSRYALAYSN